MLPLLLQRLLFFLLLRLEPVLGHRALGASDCTRATLTYPEVLLLLLHPLLLRQAITALHLGAFPG